MLFLKFEFFLYYEEVEVDGYFSRYKSPLGWNYTVGSKSDIQEN